MKGIYIPLDLLHVEFRKRLVNILTSCDSLSDTDSDVIYKATIETLEKVYAPVLSKYDDNCVDMHSIINNLQYRVSIELSNRHIDPATASFARLLDSIKIPFSDFDILMTQELIALNDDGYEVLTTLRYTPSRQELRYRTPVVVTSKAEFTSSVTKAKRTALRGILSI